LVDFRQSIFFDCQEETIIVLALPDLLPPLDISHFMFLDFSERLN